MTRTGEGRAVNEMHFLLCFESSTGVRAEWTISKNVMSNLQKCFFFPSNALSVNTGRNRQPEWFFSYSRTILTMKALSPCAIELESRPEKLKRVRIAHNIFTGAISVRAKGRCTRYVRRRYKILILLVYACWIHGYIRMHTLTLICFFRCLRSRNGYQ